MARIKLIASALVALCLGGCGSMTFGQSLLGTVGVFVEAQSIKECYESGGSREYCEEDRW